MTNNNQQGNQGGAPGDVTDLLSKAKALLKEVGDKSKSALRDVIDMSKSLASSIKNAAQNLANSVKSSFSSAFKSILPILSNVTSKMGGLIKNSLSGIGALGQYLAQKINSGLINGLKTIVTDMGKIATQKIFSSLPMSAKRSVVLAVRFLSPLTAFFTGLIVLAEAVFDKVGDGLSKGGKMIKSLSQDSGDFFSQGVAHFTEYIEKIPIFGRLLSGVTEAWASILDLLIGVEDRIVKAGRQIGLSAREATKLNDRFAEFAFNSDKAYVTSKALLESQVELTKLTGLNTIASEENLQTNMELAKFAGIEENTRAKIYETSIVTGISMKDIASSLVGQVADLKKATGISFNYQAILKEAASQSGTLGLMFAKYPLQLAKSLVNVKALGFELKELQSMGDGMLNFEQSISKEFEAQLILGKNINLNKAREAFLNNDLVGAAAEITKYAGDANSFLKLNRIEQQVYAETFNMSVDQMADFLKKQELLVKSGFATKEQLMAQVKLAKENNKLKDDLNKKLGEEQVNNLINQSMQEDLMASVEKMKQSLVDFLTRTELLDKIRSLVKELTDPDAMRGLVEKLKNVISKFVGFLASISDIALAGIQGIADFFGKGDIVGRIQEMRAGISSFSESVDAGLNKYLSIKDGDSKTTKVEDAVIYPGGDKIVKADKLDYMFLTKDPSMMAPNMSEDALQRAVVAAVRAISDRPIVVQSNLSLDGQIAARSNYTSTKNNPLLGFDRTFGQMSLNT